jgi:hypothetical protein
MAEMITSFTGEHEFLNSFHEDSFPMPAARAVFKSPGGTDRWWFNSREHAFQAAKATSYADMLRVLNTPSPYQAKRAGRVIQCRQDWEQVKRVVMMECMLAQFTCLGHLGDQLRATGDAVLVEGNTWNDTYWGAVHHGKQGLPFWQVPGGIHYYGHNWLGRLLMMVREVL